MFRLDDSGFINRFLISGVKEEDLKKPPARNLSQLDYEKYLRSIIAESKEDYYEKEIEPGFSSSINMPWRYYHKINNYFVDESTFYSSLKKIELLANTNLIAEEQIQIDIYLWSYCSIDIWHNKAYISGIRKSVYKPIQRKKISLNLVKGINNLHIRLQTLGVRDTRILFGIEILNNKDKIFIGLPGVDNYKLHEYEDFLEKIYIKNNTIYLGDIENKNLYMLYDEQGHEFKKEKRQKKWLRVTDNKINIVKDEGRIIFKIDSEYGELIRQIEDINFKKPVFIRDRQEIIRRIAQTESLSRGGKFGFSISNILARKYLDISYKKDFELFEEMLMQIEDRYDCSDFLVNGLIRYIKNYGLPEGLEKKTKNTLLNWRYWMDEAGEDGMCFWSENHALMFYTAAFLAGDIYKNDYFINSQLYGSQLSVWGRNKILEWINDILENGFEEFLSSIYVCITFIALLNIIDYADKELSDLAKNITDRLLMQVFRHSFKGSLISPMARVYREVIYPFSSGAQALINLVDIDSPYTFGEGWLAFYFTSKYKFSDDLKKIMYEEGYFKESSGNALIHMKKTENYCLTSVQSPRRDVNFTRWDNKIYDEEKKSLKYVKVLNEKFHGTTFFNPGTYGYQQHMWYAALDNEAIVFTNHPGVSCDNSSMRPGYFSGNGIMPSIMQKNNKIGIIYNITDKHPIKFTHIFFPINKFNKVYIEDNWLFAEKNNAYIGIYSSKRLVAVNDILFDCEFRSYGKNTAYFCICEDNKKYDFTGFINYAKSISPNYDEKNNTLCAGDIQLKYVEFIDDTQYI